MLSQFPYLPLNQKRIIICFLTLIFAVLFISMYYTPFFFENAQRCTAYSSLFVDRTPVKEGLTSNPVMTVTNSSDFKITVDGFLTDATYGVFDGDLNIKPHIQYKNSSTNTVYSLNTADLFIANKTGANVATIVDTNNTMTIVPLAAKSAANFVNATTYFYNILNYLNSMTKTANGPPLTQSDSIKYINDYNASGKTNARICRIDSTCNCADGSCNFLNFMNMGVYFFDPSTITYQSGAAILDINQLSDANVFSLIDVNAQTLTPLGVYYLELILSLPATEYASVKTILMNLSQPTYSGYPMGAIIKSVQSYASFTAAQITTPGPPPRPTIAPYSAPPPPPVNNTPVTWPPVSTTTSPPITSVPITIPPLPTTAAPTTAMPSNTSAPYFSSTTTPYTNSSSS